MNRRFDVVVLGGGLAGAALALALARAQRQVAIVDARLPGPPVAADPRAYAISPSAAAFLDALGVWRHFDARHLAPVAAMDIRGDRGGRLRFSAYEARCEALAWIVEAERLEGELREAARRQPQVSFFAPARPAALARDETMATLTLADGSRIAAPLLVGADGRDSWLRQTAGIAARHRDYHETGVVATFAAERPHGDTARQWFLADSVLAWLPLPGERISIVWSAPAPLAETLLACSPEALALRVAAAGDHALGRLSPLAPARGFPLRLTRVADPLSARVALIGDAAHGIHPLSGHGINLGFADARELAAAIAACAPDEDIGSERTLRRYRRARAEEVLLVQQTTDGLRQLFASRVPGLDWLRNAGLSLTDRISPVKSLLVRYAMG
jgi:2-octaprenylphenol hydroxylase